MARAQPVALPVSAIEQKNYTNKGETYPDEREVRDIQAHFTSRDEMRRNRNGEVLVGGLEAWVDELRRIRTVVDNVAHDLADVCLVARSVTSPEANDNSNFLGATQRHLVAGGAVSIVTRGIKETEQDIRVCRLQR